MPTAVRAASTPESRQRPESAPYLAIAPVATLPRGLRRAAEPATPRQRKAAQPARIPPPLALSENERSSQPLVTSPFCALNRWGRSGPQNFRSTSETSYSSSFQQQH